MRVSYRKLFSVECLHGYFTDHICRTLAWLPTSDCARLLERYRMIYRPVAGGGTVYCERSSRPDSPGLDAERPFAFRLASADPLLDTYTASDTDTAAEPADGVHYFSNRDPEAAILYGQARLLLHAAGHPFAEQPLQVRAHRFMHGFDAPVTGANVMVAHAQRGIVWRASLVGEQRAVAVDLRGQACGRYSLSVNGRVELDFYLSDSPAPAPWGIVEIFPDAADFETKEYTFSVALTARETLWRYYIFPPLAHSADYADFQIVDETPRNGASVPAPKAIQFNPLAAPVTRGGREGIGFESARAIALREAPTSSDGLFLYKPMRSSGPPIALPYAEPGMTRLEVVAGIRAMYSEIFVYV